MDNMKPLNPIQKTVVGVQFLLWRLVRLFSFLCWLALILLPPFLLLVSAR